MINEGDYQHICRTPEEIPEEVYTDLRREIGRVVGQPVSVMFPGLANAFPLTVSAMERHWPVPLLICRKPLRNWFIDLVMPKPEINLFLELSIASTPVNGERFDRNCAMLPLRWRELYRYLWSFVITTDGQRPLSWNNTPASFSNRLRLEEFRRQIGATKVTMRAFENKVSSGQADLKCWMWTEAGDALFLDEKAKDHRVFHIQGNNLEDSALLPDPEDLLDRYLAHVVSGSLPGSFKFRET